VLRPIVHARRVLGHGGEQRGDIVGRAARREFGAETAELGLGERERVGLGRRRRWQSG